MDNSVLKNATTGLAGAVALASGSQAYGAIKSSTVPPNIAASATNTPTTQFWDVNGDGTVDFQLTVGVYAGTSSSGAAFATSYAGVSGANAAYSAFGFVNRVVGYVGSFGNYASRLATGTSIGASSTFVYGDYLTILASRFNGKSYGALRTQGNVGFEFMAADGLHYGYINLRSTVAGTGTTNTNYTASTTFFTAYYQTTPDTAILAGAVPEPTSLAALTCGVAGAAGAAAYRRKKAAKAAKAA